MRRWSWWAVAVASVASVGCGEGRAPPAARPPVSAAAPLIQWPADFVRDMDASEEVALTGLYRGAGEALCAGLRARSVGAVRATLAPDFQGRLLGAPAVVPVPPGEAVALRRWAPSEATLGAPAFAEAILAFSASLAAVERCSLKPFHFKLAADRARAVADLRFSLAGHRVGGGAVIRRGTWTVEAVPGVRGGAWRYRRVLVGAVEEVAAVGQAFTEVGAQVGLVLPQDALRRENLRGHVDIGSMENLGGLAALDFDRDGREDLFAWHRGRGLWWFRNDGAGGFQRHAGIIPPADVGDHVLLVDLDGDGEEELVSTALGRCAEGVARFPLYTRRGLGFVAVPGGLPVPRDCADFRTADLYEAEPVVFQHVAAADVDRDGDLDLYFAGYQNRRSRRARFNLYDAEDGEPDRLLINQGGLRFTDETASRGLSSQRWSYVSTFFDLDEDGDEDLYVANDYGPNSLYLNDGRGHFTPAPPSPMTANSQSMGLTVADMDGDLHLDLYVSNMYSTAGNRIVPLAEGVLDPATYRTLLGSAAGNWLFRRDAKGQYTEVAAALGVQRAGWAWGQAAVDLDDDGDRDLYVVNGMTSNSKDKEHDF